MSLSRPFDPIIDGRHNFQSSSIHQSLYKCREEHRDLLLSLYRDWEQAASSSFDPSTFALSEATAHNGKGGGTHSNGNSNNNRRGKLGGSVNLNLNSNQIGLEGRARHLILSLQPGNLLWFTIFFTELLLHLATTPVHVGLINVSLSGIDEQNDLNANGEKSKSSNIGSTFRNASKPNKSFSSATSSASSS